MDSPREATVRGGRRHHRGVFQGRWSPFMTRSFMNIKFFAPGSKESYCPALSKSQGYSRNKQSCPSPGEMHAHGHTRTHAEAEGGGSTGGGLSGAVSRPRLPGHGVLLCTDCDQTQLKAPHRLRMAPLGEAPPLLPPLTSLPCPALRDTGYSPQKQWEFDSPKTELPGEGAVGTSCEWDKGSWVCGQRRGAQPRVKQRPGLGPVRREEGGATQF